MFNVDNDDFDVKHFITLQSNWDDNAPHKQAHYCHEFWLVSEFETDDSTQWVDIWTCEKY